MPPQMKTDPKMEKYSRLVWMAGAAALKEIIITEIAALPDDDAAIAMMEIDQELQDFADTERAKHWGGENPINQ